MHIGISYNINPYIVTKYNVSNLKQHVKLEDNISLWIKFYVFQIGSVIVTYFAILVQLKMAGTVPMTKCDENLNICLRLKNCTANM